MPSKPPTVVQADGFNLASEQKRVWAERLRPRTQVNYTEPEGSDSDRVKNPRPTAKRRLNNDEEAYADDDLSDDEWDYDDLPQYKGTFMPAAFDDISEGAVPPLPGNTPPPSPMIPTGDLLSPPSMWTAHRDPEANTSSGDSAPSSVAPSAANTPASRTVGLPADETMPGKEKPKRGRHSSRKRVPLRPPSPHEILSGSSMMREELHNRKVLCRDNTDPIAPTSYPEKAAKKAARHRATAAVVSTPVDVTIDLANSTSNAGWVGLDDSRQAEPIMQNIPWPPTQSDEIPETPTERLAKWCKDNGYRLIQGDTEKDLIIIDSEGIPVVVRGKFGEEHFTLLAEMNVDCRDFLKRMKLAGFLKPAGRRGGYTSAMNGVSYGGGQEVPMHISDLKDTWKKRTCSDLWNEFLNKESVRKFMYWASALFKTHFPDLYEAYESCLIELRRRDDQLFPVIPPFWPWAAATVNSSPAKTNRHRDFLNLIFGMCAIIPAGDFDPEKGGHVVLHELKMVVTLNPGQVLLIPSACITHENTPLAAGEERFSITLFSAGGLFRWVNYGCQSFKDAKAKADRATRRQWRTQGMEQWARHWMTQSNRYKVNVEKD